MGLSPKHMTNVIMKHIKEDVIQAPPEKVTRARFAVDFESSLSAVLYMSFLLRISQQLFILLCDLPTLVCSVHHRFRMYVSVKCAGR